MAEETKRGRGRPRKWTEDNPKPPRKDNRDEKNPLEMIRAPKASFPMQTAVDFLPEGENNKYTAVAVAVMNMPKIDYRNPEQLRARVIEYFQLCADNDMKPGVAGISLAIGMNRRRMWEIKNDIKNTTIPRECHEIIKQAYDSLEALWELYMQNSKINPVSGIFIAKNNFGYKDQQDYVVSPATNDMPSRETIEAKYEELPD